jgi:large subunit GTPase 1
LWRKGELQLQKAGHDVSSSYSTSSMAKHVVVGFVGYPNVGTSSTIYALVGDKKISVTHTPGKTEHFQTLIISEELMLCDCPGRIFLKLKAWDGGMWCLTH